MVDAASLDPCGQRPVQMHRPHTNDRRRTSLNDHPKALSSAHRLNDQHSPPKAASARPVPRYGPCQGGCPPQHSYLEFSRRLTTKQQRCDAEALKRTATPRCPGASAKPPRRDHPKGFLQLDRSPSYLADTITASRSTENQIKTKFFMIFDDFGQAGHAKRKKSRRPQRGTGRKNPNRPSPPPTKHDSNAEGGTARRGPAARQKPQPTPTPANRNPTEPVRPGSSQGPPTPLEQKERQRTQAPPPQKDPPTQKSNPAPAQGGRTKGRGLGRAGSEARTPRGRRIGRPNTKVQGRPNGDSNPRTPPPGGAATHPRGQRRGGASSTRGRAEPTPTEPKPVTGTGCSKDCSLPLRRPTTAPTQRKGTQRKPPGVRPEGQQHTQVQTGKSEGGREGRQPPTRVTNRWTHETQSRNPVRTTRVVSCFGETRPQPRPKRCQAAAAGGCRTQVPAARKAVIPRGRARMNKLACTARFRAQPQAAG